MKWVLAMLLGWWPLGLSAAGDVQGLHAQVLARIKAGAAAPAGITFNAADEFGWTVADNNPSFTVTITDCTNGHALVGFHWYTDVVRAISSVTFDGNACAEVEAFTVDLGGGSETGFAFYELALGSKAAGTYTVQVTWADVVNEGAMGVVVHNGVHQTVATGTPTSGTAAGATTETTGTQSSATGEMCVALFGQTDTTVSVSGGGTQRWKVDNTTTFADAQCSTEPGAASVEMTWDSSPAADLGYGWIFVSLKPAE